jgi:hypothetical protein
MNTRHIQTFLMVSAAFFAMNLPARTANNGRSGATSATFAAAATHAARMSSAGVAA